jgi:hypothetical protein
MTDKINKNIKKALFLFAILAFILVPLVSAGVGIKWSQESVLINEKEKPCLTYSVYNPWPAESYVNIELSDELKDVLTMQQSDSKLIPANTPSSSAIPVQFCFKVPRVYREECMILNKLICKQSCSETQKAFDGDVLVKTVPAPAEVGGSGGSTTSMAVSAPLKIKVNCVSSSYLTNKKNQTLFLVLIAIISLIGIMIVLQRKRSKTQLERDESRLRKLQEKIKKEKLLKKQKK